VLEVQIPEPLFVEYEWVEDGKTYREALIPATRLNAYRRTLRVLTDDEADALGAARWTTSERTS
jgi:hypothetical protein